MDNITSEDAAIGLARFATPVQTRNSHSIRRPPAWLDTGSESPSDAVARASAAAAAVVAAAVASVRSRPASLSTISEEPSHSNSTVSLNRVTPPNNGLTSSETSYGLIVENDAAKVPQSPRRRSVTHCKHEFNLHNISTNLISSVDLIQMSKLLSTDASATAFCESLCDSMLSSASSSRSSTKSHQFVARNPTDLVIDPHTARTLLAAVTATGYQAVRKRFNHDSGDVQSELLAPPPYSSVINEHNVNPSKSRKTSKRHSNSAPDHSPAEPNYRELEERPQFSHFNKPNNIPRTSPASYHNSGNNSPFSRMDASRYSSSGSISVSGDSHPTSRMSRRHSDGKLAAQAFNQVSDTSFSQLIPNVCSDPIRGSQSPVSPQIVYKNSGGGQTDRSHKIHSSRNNPYFSPESYPQTSRQERKKERIRDSAMTVDQQVPGPSIFPDISPDAQSNLDS